MRFLLRLLRPPRTTELPPVAWCLAVESNSPWRQQTFPKQQLLLRRRLPSPQLSSSSTTVVPGLRIGSFLLLLLLLTKMVSRDL